MKQKLFLFIGAILFIAGLFLYTKSLAVLNQFKTARPVIISDPNDYIEYNNEIENPYTDRHYDGFRWAQQNNMRSCDQSTLDAVGSDSFSEGCQKFIQLESIKKLNRRP